MVTAWVKVDDTVSMVWGMYKPCINLTFGDCAMYFDHGYMLIGGICALGM